MSRICLKGSFQNIVSAFLNSVKLFAISGTKWQHENKEENHTKLLPFILLNFFVAPVYLLNFTCCRPKNYSEFIKSASLQHATEKTYEICEVRNVF